MERITSINRQLEELVKLMYNDEHPKSRYVRCKVIIDQSLIDKEKEKPSVPDNFDAMYYWYIYTIVLADKFRPKSFFHEASHHIHITSDLNLLKFMKESSISEVRKYTSIFELVASDMAPRLHKKYIDDLLSIKDIRLHVII